MASSHAVALGTGEAAIVVRQMRAATLDLVGRTTSPSPERAG